MLVVSSVLLSAGVDALVYVKNLFVSYWCDGNLSEEKKIIVINSQKECKCTLDEFGLRFWPPLYTQRYMAVQEIIGHPIWKGSIKKVVDFGCSELGFFKHLKPVPGLQNIVLVDVDFDTLDLNQAKVLPINYDYLSDRKEPLTVDIYNGSIADLDDRMLGLDAVICIELIEHLYLDVLAAVPFTVFGFIKPKLAVFTTPNVEFNILFPNFTTQFRHDDHQFEWTRKQFQNWAYSVTSKYSEYAVQFDGIGIGPPGNENVGCCSQMAIFYRKDMNTSPANPVGSTPYKLLRRVNYPFELNDDNAIIERTVFDRLKKFVSGASSRKEYLVGHNMEIPLNIIMPYFSDCCSSVEDLENYVRKLYHTEINDNGECLMVRAMSEYSSDENISDSMSNHSGQEYSLLEDSANNQYFKDDWNSSVGMHFGDSKLCYSTPMTKNEGVYLSNAESLNTFFSNSELYKTAVDYNNEGNEDLEISSSCNGSLAVDHNKTNEDMEISSSCNGTLAVDHNKSNEDMEISSSCNGSLVVDDCKVYQDFALGRNSSGEDISEIEETMTCVTNSHESSKNSDEVNDNTIIHHSSDTFLKSDCSSDAAHGIKSQNCDSFSDGTIKEDCKEIDNQSSVYLNRTLLDESGYTENVLSTSNKTL